MRMLQIWPLHSVSAAFPWIKIDAVDYKVNDAISIFVYQASQLLAAR